MSAEGFNGDGSAYGLHFYLRGELKFIFIWFIFKCQIENLKFNLYCDYENIHIPGREIPHRIQEELHRILPFDRILQESTSEPLIETVWISDDVCGGLQNFSLMDIPTTCLQI